MGDFVNNGCILLSPRMGFEAVKDNDAIDENDIIQCVNLLAPLDIQQCPTELSSDRESSNLSGSRVLTLIKDR